MMKMKKKEGFTLIELLIVVAIIGLLATLAIIGLTTAQQRARDTKRVADTKSLVSALELYWNDTAEYPILNDAISGDINTWDELNTALSSYINQLPTDAYAQDVSKSATYFYTYLMDTASNNAYYISATLETDTHQALTQDIDGSSLGGANWKSLTSTDTFDGTAATLDCDDPVYCLFGDATSN